MPAAAASPNPVSTPRFGPLIQRTPILPGPNLHSEDELADPLTLQQLTEHSQRVRAQLAQRPSHRAELEILLLDICIAQAAYVRRLQEHRDGLYPHLDSDPVHTGAALERAEGQINQEAQTLTRLVRSYRMFVPTTEADPANFAHLFNPFLDWLEKHHANHPHRQNVQEAISAFVAHLPWR